MSRAARVLAESDAASRTFLRRRTAMMFTFLFPVLLVLIFGALITTDPTEGGLFTEAPLYYIPGYLAVVVMFTPLSRIGAVVIRHRNDNRFEKLATTPLSRAEWLLAHTLVTAVLVALASALVVVVLAIVADVPVPRSPAVIAFILLGVAMFSGMGACLGRLTRTQDGVIAAANTIALPMLFLAETFVPPALLPTWFRPVIPWLPLTPFTRGMRAVVQTGDPWFVEFAILVVLATGFLVLGAYALPRAE